MAESIAFYTLAAFILGFAVLVVTTKDTVHSVLFLVLDFLFVAALYVLLGAQFLAAIQVLVYAGGIVVLYLFVVMLVNLKRPPEEYRDPRRRSMLGLALSAAVLLELGVIAVGSRMNPAPPLIAGAAAAMPVTGNTEQVGWLLYTRYLIPFEIASMLLLVAMIGAIVLAKEGTVITPAHYMMLSAALFIIGVAGVMMRRNIIIIFMSIELILNAVNINLVAYSYQQQNVVGQVFAVFVIAVAAAEAAVGLGIILAFYRNKETVNIDEMNLMRW